MTKKHKRVDIAVYVVKNGVKLCYRNKFYPDPDDNLEEQIKREKVKL